MSQQNEDANVHLRRWTGGGSHSQQDKVVPLKQRYTTQPKLDPLWNLQPVQFTEEWVVCSDLLTKNTRRAAAFMTDCSRCNSVPEIPANTEQQ